MLEEVSADGRRRHPSRGQVRLGISRSVYEVAPTARASCRHVESQGNVAGKCRTIRRTERWTHTASLISRSRSVGTWASAQVVPRARRRRAGCGRWGPASDTPVGLSFSGSDDGGVAAGPPRSSSSFRIRS